MRTLVIVGIVAIVVIFLINKKNRIDKIDFLNSNVGPTGKWTQMSTDELNTCFTVWALIAKELKPSDEDYLQMMQIFKKYGITEKDLSTRKN